MNVFIYGSTIGVHYYKDLIRCYGGDIINSLFKFDNYFDLKFWDTDEFVEDSVIIAHKYWLNDLAEPEQVQRLKAIKNKKLVIIAHGYSYCNNIGPESLTQMRQEIENLSFQLNQVYFVTQLPSDIPVIREYLPGVRVHHCDEWLREFMQYEGIPFIQKRDHFKNKPNIDFPHKRFCTLFRRYDQPRLNFVFQLEANDLLNNFNYTFSNRTGMDLADITNIDDMKNLIPEELESHRNKLEHWLSTLPHEVNYNTDETYQFGYPSNLRFLIQNSDINVVYETNPITGNSTITEKTYKSMFYKKPFILVCHPYSMKILQDSGYKSFSPYIDESYDNIEFYPDRVDAIIREIKRINSLSETEMRELIDNCAPIVEHNFKVLMDNYYAPWPDEFTIKEIIKEKFE